jgi:hypothetical protein
LYKKLDDAKIKKITKKIIEFLQNKRINDEKPKINKKKIRFKVLDSSPIS